VERLQKTLARAGIASRRAAEQIILAGRVRVDGRIVRELGTQVDPRKSRVEVDGNKIVAENLVYIVLHKPRGVVCTLSDPEGRPTIRELIKDAGARLVPVGRLDFHTSGALLCTNDGEFAQALAHPTREVPKIYVAKVKGTVDDDALERFSERIVIDGRPTQPAQVKRLRFEGDKTWLEITLREGRNRQVRRLGEATGFPVMRLARLSHAGVTSEDLRPGQWRELTADELVELKKHYGVPKKVRAPSLDYTKGKAGRGEGPAAKFEKQALRKGAFKKANARARDDSRFPSRSEPQRGERAQTPRRPEPTRPWREQSTRHDREQASGNTRQGRGAAPVKKGTTARGPERRAQEKRNLRGERAAGQKGRSPEPTARRDEPRFSRRRGTSR
jgi:23S rRNA pseudouridine2605 synthase